MDHLLVKKEPERERISRSKNRRKEANCTRKKGSKYLVSSNADASRLWRHLNTNVRNQLIAYADAAREEV